MSKELFPKEIIEHTAEANFSKHGIRSRLIYVTAIGAVVAILVALPIIDVAVSVRSSGVIRPVTERNKLVSPVSGKIDKLYIKENEKVSRGEIVAKISSPVLQEEFRYALQRQQQVNRYLADLSVLLSLNAEKVLKFFDIDKNNHPVFSPLLAYQKNISEAIQHLNQRQNSGDITIITESNRGSLTEARKALFHQLTKSPSLILKEATSEGDRYKKKLSTFRQRMEPYITAIKKHKNDIARREKLNKMGIVSDKKLQTTINKWDQAWSQLLSALTNDLLSLLNRSKQVNDSSPNYLKQVLHNKLESPKYKNSLLTFIKRIRNSVQQIKKVQKKFERKKRLFQRSVISEAAYDKIKFKVESLYIEYNLLFEKQLNKWRKQQIKLENELEDLNLKQRTIEDKKDKYVLRAPVSGTIQNMKGLYEGGTVVANQPLAVISPDTSLIAEIYVPPGKIGLIKKGMPVTFQVSAFDYNQWGFIAGKVKAISNDVVVMNKQPVFKINCTLNKTWLTLKNGYKGNLKKGMRVQARFKITERSLFQLLYDNLDDWLNPKWDEKNIQRQQASL